jgi:DNA polymerase I
MAVNRLYFDAETSGLNPHKDRLCTVQYCSDANPHPQVITQAYDKIPQIVELIQRHDSVVGHNIGFDFGFLGYTPESIDKFDDTFYLSRICDYSELKHSLDAVALRVFGRDMYAGFDKKSMQKSDWSSSILTDQQIEYAKMDVAILPDIYKRYSDYLNDPVYLFDKQSVIAGLSIEKYGLPTDTFTLKEEIRQTEFLRDVLLDRIPVNPNSPKQCSELLGTKTTGDKMLALLVQQGNRYAKDIRDCRKAIKYLNFLSKLSDLPRFYGTLKPAARSGRFTSSQENIQNLPRATKKFIAARPGRVLISADFAALELRTIAALTNDATMVDLFISGADLHGHTAASMFGEDFTEDQRYIAKTFNFSMLYGAGAPTIQSMLLAQTDVWLDATEIQKLMYAWLDTYRGIAAWQRGGKRSFYNGDSGRTPLGRRYKAARYNEHLSLMNQSAGAEIARIALHTIKDNISSDVHFINFVHDCYVLECDNNPDIYKPACEIVHSAMVSAWESGPLNTRGIPMPVDVGVAQNWKDADGLKNCIFIYRGNE